MPDAYGMDWDAWRSDYASMSWDEQRKFYDEVWRLYPSQKHFDPDACARLLEKVRPSSVVEVGGWCGELAAEMLRRFDWLGAWRNYEVCGPAVEASVTSDPRYIATVPNDWPWTEPLYGDVLILSHTIEHMTFEDLKNLLASSNARAAFVASPLKDDGQEWPGYTGSHVMREGWKDVMALFESHGMKYDPAFDAYDTKCFLS